MVSMLGYACPFLLQGQMPLFTSHCLSFPHQWKLHFLSPHSNIFEELGGGVDDVLGWCRDVSILASDDYDGWLTSRPPWFSVPLTVDFILRLDRVFISFVMLAFTTLMLRDC